VATRCLRLPGEPGFEPTILQTPASYHGNVMMSYLTYLLKTKCNPKTVMGIRKTRFKLNKSEEQLDYSYQAKENQTVL